MIKGIGISPEEVVRESAQLLPDREAMSLFSTSPSPLLSDYGDFGTQEHVPSAEEAYGIAQVDASESETGGVTAEDRSEIFTQSDSAVAES